MAITQTRSAWAVLLVTLVGVAYFLSLERSFFDRFMAYEPLDVRYDEPTGKYVELGRLWDPGSQVFEVAVYDSPNPQRKASQLNRQLLSVVHPTPYPARVEFDGRCYFVRTELREAYTAVEGNWTDRGTGKSLCFYLLTPEGRQISNFP
jgi:hypothetical protein